MYQIHVETNMFMLKAITFFIEADSLQAAERRVQIAMKEMGVVEYVSSIQLLPEDFNK